MSSTNGLAKAVGHCSTGQVCKPNRRVENWIGVNACPPTHLLLLLPLRICPVVEGRRRAGVEASRGLPAAGAAGHGGEPPKRLHNNHNNNYYWRHCYPLQ